MKKKVIQALIFVLVSAFVNAFVMLKLWQWILIPVLGIHSISMGAAFGLCVFIGFIKARRPEDSKPVRDDDIYKSLSWLIAKSFLFLLTGWVASLFI